MNSNVTLARNELFAAMDADKPRASYRKTILGKVAVSVWDNFLDRPTEVILQGNPSKNEPGCFVSVYSDREKAFFERTNLKLFKKGLIIPYTLPDVPVIENTIEQATDDELRDIVNSKFMALQAKLNKIESTPVLFRMRAIAEELDKSNKITGAIEKRISELQVEEYSPKIKVERVEEE